LKAVTTLEEGKYYVAKVSCKDCPVVETEGQFENRKHFVVDGVENDLVCPHPPPEANPTYGAQFYGGLYADLLFSSSTISPYLTMRTRYC
jgi:hypothetical protein